MNDIYMCNTHTQTYTHTTCLCVFLEADDTDDKDTQDSKVHGAYMGPTWGRQAPGTLLSGTVKSFQNPLGMSVAEMEIISSDNDVLNNSPGFTILLIYACSLMEPK